MKCHGIDNIGNGKHRERERGREGKREVVRSANQNDLSTEHNRSDPFTNERDD